MALFAIKRRRTEVAVGQIWRTVSVAPSYWEVLRIYDDSEGISHVALRQVDDPTSRKTIATELLLTELGYRLVSHAVEASEPIEVGHALEA